MTARIAEEVHEILRARAPRALAADDLHAERLLGAEGLGLDSIAIAEVLLECEERFRVRVTALLEGESITIGRIIDYVGEMAER